MGKRTALTSDELFERAEQVRQESLELRRQFLALRELRTLERDFHAVTKRLAETLRAIDGTEVPQGLLSVLIDAAELTL
jgi:hypothetical protein